MKLLLLMVLAAALDGQTTGSMPLQPGKTVERQLASGQSHEYSLAIRAGQYARVLVDQRSINLAVTVFGPEGRELFAADAAGIGEAEPAEWIAKVGGSYRIRLAPSEPQAPNGSYAVTLEGVEPATERHAMRVAGTAEFARAMTSYKKGTRAAMLEAADRLGRALAHWRAAHDRALEVRALVPLALVHAELGNQQKAQEYAAQSLPAARDSHDSRAEARALDCIGQVRYYFGDKREAIGYYEKALMLMRAAGGRAAEGSTLSNLAVAYSRTGEKRKALALLEEALRIFQGLQDRRMMAEVAGNMGVTYDDLGEYQKALESHQRDLALKRELDDRPNQAIAWNNVGIAYSGVAAYQKALDAYTAALEINRSMDNRRSVAINLNNIAWVYEQLADRSHALAFYQQSLEIVRKLNDPRLIGVTLNNIAEIHADSGDYRKSAVLHAEALSFRHRAGDADGEANSLNNLGKVYLKLGDREKARDHFEKALAMHRTTGNRHMMARALRNLGELHGDGGEHERSQRYLDEALATSRAIRDPAGEGAALADVARLERARGNFARAHERADEAMSVLESVRLTVASPKLRASFFASARELEEFNIEVLMRLHAAQPGSGFDAAALLASERGRARSLLEMLGEGAAGIRRGVDPVLLSRERELERLISSKAEVRSRLLGSKPVGAEAQAITRELDVFAAQLEQVQSRIRESSPEYAALTQPIPLNLQGIQTKVLDGGTVLLEYALGRDKSFLFAVTAVSMHVFELPPRAEIESAATHLYQLLTARNQTSGQETGAERADRLRQADSEFRSAAARTSRMLLAPAAPVIAGKRLLIIREGVLQYLPFSALPDPAAADCPLVAKHEIATAPSASVIAVLREHTAARKHAERAVAVLADPVFSADDSRISGRSRTAMAASAKNTRAGGEHFARLRFSRAEAEEIARLAPPGSILKALDFDASRETAMRPEIGQYRIVHFATHSLLDNQHPELSGVVLSLFDRAGRPRNGFLRLYDVYNLRLGSDLVVLSACKTALGGDIRGEGLIGLTRGFLYAGAARVVATLWEVDDRTTAELMKHFYRSVLTEGERPAAALRAAQVAMSKTKGWESPYYWAAFTLHGEWR